MEERIFELEPSPTDLKLVLDAIQEMQESLNTEGLSKHTRETLQERLNRIKEAVEGFSTSGFRGVRESNEYLWGTIATDTIIRTDFGTNTQKKGDLFEKLMKVGRAVALVLQLMHTGHQVEQDYLPVIEQYILPHLASEQQPGSNQTSTAHTNAKN